MSTTELTEGGSDTPTVSDDLIPVYIMGKRYHVPQSLTIMKAMEYAGYQYVRGAGCRGGICGACATVYRKPGDFHIRTGLACQTVVEPDMYLTQLPFFPANRPAVDFEAMEGTVEEVHAVFPEIFRCVACNACSKVCPMDVETMDYIAAIKQGDFERATEISFDCIQCGLCVSRCMGELPQYHIAQLVRRIQGSKLTPKCKHLQEMVDRIATGTYKEAITALKATDVEGIKKLYVDREMEPAMTGEDWTPKDSTYL